MPGWKTNMDNIVTQIAKRDKTMEILMKEWLNSRKTERETYNREE
jgi:hypothetical protein